MPITLEHVTASEPKPPSALPVVSENPSTWPSRVWVLPSLTGGGGCRCWQALLGARTALAIRLEPGFYKPAPRSEDWKALIAGHRRGPALCPAGSWGHSSQLRQVPTGQGKWGQPAVGSSGHRPGCWWSVTRTLHWAPSLGRCLPAAPHPEEHGLSVMPHAPVSPRCGSYPTPLSPSRQPTELSAALSPEMGC